MSPRIAVTSVLSLFLCACDFSLYSATSNSNGQTYVLNRYTGSLSEVSSGAVFPVKEQAAPAQQAADKLLGKRSAYVLMRALKPELGPGGSFKNVSIPALFLRSASNAAGSTSTPSFASDSGLGFATALAR